MSTLLYTLFFTVLAIGCHAGKTDQADNQSSLSQGIRGTLKIRKGDFMPSPEPDKANRGTETPTPGQVYIYQAMSVNKAGMGPFYKNLGEPHAIAEADEEGLFSASLPPGTYSLFIHTPDGLYANSFDGRGLINPVTVEEGKVTETTLTRDDQATY